MSLGLVIVGMAVGDMVGEVDPSSQSMAAPGSKGGTHLEGCAEPEGAPVEGVILGAPEEDGASEVVGLLDADGIMDGS